MQQNTKIFLLNAPPFCGKDSLGNWCVSHGQEGYVKEKMAYPLKKANQELFSMSDEEFQLFDNDPAWKNKPQERFYGKSWRDVNIDLSEKYIKKNFDIEFFGRSLVSRIKNNKSSFKNFVISDSGFREEAIPLVKEFGNDNVFLIRLYRPNHDFAGDSRSYWDHKSLGIQEFELHNDGDELSFVINGLNLIQSLVTGQPFKKYLIV